jgi:riboflavin kinase / FMN adenylyltransferase
MQLFDGSSPLPSPFHNAIVAIGNFDGMHRGHQQLLATAAEHAKAEGTSWGIVTFEPHPRTFFKPDEPIFRLTPPALKARLAKALGASFMVEVNFDKALSNLSAAEFVATHLVEHMSVRHVVTGYDFHFGRGRTGNPIVLRELGKTHGFGVTIVDQISDEEDGHSPFSSSSIRSSLRRGHVAAAARELGYHWTVMGEVVHGDKRGRTIGFPTLNIVLEKGAEPFRGIYAVRVRDTAQPGMAPWPGAGYFGDRPTFDSPRTFLEVYLLGMDIDLYGRILQVEFIDMIRPDRRFASVDELVTQMRLDCGSAEKILAQLAKDDPVAEYPIGKTQAQGLL